MKLSDAHRKMLFEESGIDHHVIAERGYRTVKRRAELEEFPEWQRRLGLYIPTYSPDGETVGCLLRPNKTRKPDLKYEAPQESRVILDVHPRVQDEVRNEDQDLFVVEGTKKADALLSRGAATVALTSVWMAHVPKSKPKRLLPCWDHVRLAGRRVFVVFDSDWRRNDTVHSALEWLVGALEDRGADVRVAYLQDNPDGKKVGADDYLVTGGTVSELKALCRRFERQDVGKIRISRDEKLRALVVDLHDRFWGEEWKGMGGHSARDVYLKLIEAAERHGKIHHDGLRVKKAQGPLLLETKISSSRTLEKALSRLEDGDLIYRDNENRKVGEPGAFVLLCTSSAIRANVKHKGGIDANDDKNITKVREAYDASTLHLRGPRQRWSTPGRKRRPRYGMVPGTRQTRSRPTTEERVPDEKLAGVKRLGKIRGAVVDALDVSGGSLTLREIASILHRSRPRDIRRRILPMLEDAEIVTLDRDLVSLTDDWMEALDRKTDHDADDDARKAYKRRREAFQAHLAGVSKASKRQVKASRERRAKHLRDKPPPEPGPTSTPSPLAVAIRDYLDKNPRDARQPAGWIGLTLWALDLFPGKPTPDQIRAAIGELGGAAYLEEKLKEAKGAA